jgi:ATP-dependent RNA helicase SUPV3L1/SUV3
MKNDKYWTLGTLKSRSWTESLIAELLPKPRYRHLGGKRIRTWVREDVTAAEKSDRFLKASEALKARQNAVRGAAQAEVGAALQGAAALLSRAWGEQADPGSRTSLLAQKYHEAILKQIPTVTWAEKLKPGQAMSYIDRFLSLEDGRPGEQTCGDLRHFLTAAVWMGRNSTSGLMQKLLEHYGEVLTAVADRAIAQFSADQPEANLDGFLQMRKFPVQELLSHPLSYLYSVFYVPRAIRTSLEMLAALNPKDEYPEARSMSRHFVLHIGGPTPERPTRAFSGSWR